MTQRVSLCHSSSSFSSWVQNWTLGEGVVCVCEEGGCVAGWTHVWVLSVAFSPDGQHIVSGSEDNLVKVWSVSARKEVASLAGGCTYVHGSP